MSENKDFNGGKMPEYCPNIHESIREIEEKREDILRQEIQRIAGEEYREITISKPALMEALENYKNGVGRWFSPEEKLPKLGERVVVVIQTTLVRVAEFVPSLRKVFGYSFLTSEGSFAPDKIVMWTRLPDMYEKYNGDMVRVKINLPKGEK